MQHKHAIIVSVFICAGLAILALCVFTLGTQRNTFVKKVDLKVDFDDINGLQAGSNVWFSGVKIGTVSKVTIINVSGVQVTLSIDQKVQQFIRKNAKAKISSDGFIGNKIVVIYGGTADALAISAGDYLATEKVVSTEDMLATLQLNNKNLLAITDNIKIITGKIADGRGPAGMLISDESLAGDIKSAIGNFEIASKNSNQIINNLAAFSNNLNKQSTSLNRLVSDTALFARISAIVENIEKATDSARILINNLKTATTNISTASDKLDSSNNTVGLLLNDKETAANVKQMLNNLNQGSQKLNDDLETLQHNFLLRNFFKKKAKAATQ